MWVRLPPSAPGFRRPCGFFHAGRSSATKRLVLVDGYSVLNRAFHALPIFTTRAGQPTNAIHGFLLQIWKVFDKVRPDYVLVALDRPGDTFRDEIYSEYKGTRPETAPELVAQLGLFEDALDALDIPHIGVPGYEADDIMGTVAKRAAKEGVHADILTGDRDLLQLVGADVNVLLVRGPDRVETMDRTAVKGFLGVEPEQVPDLKALTGDTSDNIPGVRGIGDKTAVRFLEGGRTIEDLFTDPESLPGGRMKELLLAGREVAELSKNLATIRTDVDLDLPIDRLAFRRPAGEKAAAFLRKYELHTVMNRLGINGVGAVADDGSLKEVDPGRAADLATLSQATLLGVAFGEGSVGLASADASGIFTLDEARDLLASSVPKVFHDAKPDLRRLAEGGMTVGGTAFDTAIAAYLLSSTADRYPLDETAAHYLRLRPPAGDGALAGRAKLVLLLERTLSEELEREGLLSLMREVEMPLLFVLLAMELNGIAVDRRDLEEMGEELGRQIATVLERIAEEAGGPFNVGSTPQLREVLFERLGLPVIKRTKTGPSTDADVLEALAPKHPIVADILAYRQLTKLKGTYTDGLLPFIQPDGRIHAVFGQMVAATGRLSCKDPNLQNIPVRMEEGRKIRRLFHPSRPGRLFVTADYSQIELRVLAHLSGDEALRQAFVAGEDFHTETAAAVFGVGSDGVTSEMRRRAKAVNFGIVYGISDYGLARSLDIDLPEAHEIIRRYFERYPKVKDYLDHTVASAREKGYATTILGRRRPLPDINHKNRAVRAFAERTAMNTPIQGSAADILKLAMVRVFESLRARERTYAFLLSVHDELILEAEEEDVAWTVSILKDGMEHAIEISVPIVTEIHTGATWYDVKPWVTRA